MAEIRELKNESSLEEIFNEPKAMLFIKSTRCGISRRAEQELEKFVAEAGDELHIYRVDVLTQRKISDRIAERTGIRHQSPQAIYLEAGQSVWNASHFEITAENLKKATVKQ